MLFQPEQRLSDSPFVERIWRTTSSSEGPFISLALSHWQMCIWTSEGKTHLTVRGPETKATEAYCPPDADFFGIIFKLGTFMPDMPSSQLVDAATDLPTESNRGFLLNSETWQFPDFENADTFVDQLVRADLLVHEPIVDAALQGYLKEKSLRSVQRSFLRATGMSHTAIRQIERARYAVSLLEQGATILDTIDLAGYYDQPHLTRALKYYAGLTPAQIMPERNPHQLSIHWQPEPAILVANKP
jgi:AraC-like DNA-binding protein